MKSLRPKLWAIFFLLFLSLYLARPNREVEAIDLTQTLAKWGIQVEILPTSPLYPFKLYWEDIQLVISAPNSEERAFLLAKLCRRRLQEAADQISTSEELPQLKLFNLLERYRKHYRELSELEQSLQVGSRKLNHLLEEHQQEKDQLLELIGQQESRLSKFWVNEITFSLRPPQRQHLAQQKSASDQVLGTQNQAGLKLYPLESRLGDGQE